MKYIILVPDGMADEPIEALGGKTPLEAARTPNFDRMAKEGFSGIVKTIPDGFPPGSDIGNLSLLGYDPAKNFSGRSPLEAANMGITLADDEVAFRCNLVTIKDNVITDYSAGHITTEDAAPLIGKLNEMLGSEDIKFYVGKSYRHIVVMKTPYVSEFLGIKCVPPHDIPGKDIVPYLPQGPMSENVLGLMEQAKKALKTNRTAANAIWLWGQGKRPNLPSFKSKFNLTGSIISAVDLVNGIGRLAGLEIINVPGATGYYDTNYAGKAEYGLESLKKNDFVYIHVESPDEAGHNGDHKEKVKAIENIDREIAGRILKYAEKNEVRVLVSPDHPTPVSKRTHTRTPVCFLMYGKGVTPNNLSDYSEKTAAGVGLKFQSGAAMVAELLKH
jgi:2,3-bisphosphoglycerate-independent phosphoglycerate mutase